MIEKFARACGKVVSEFLDLNHTTETMFPSVLYDCEVRSDTSAEL
jgi:hypothetical protein